MDLDRPVRTCTSYKNYKWKYTNVRNCEIHVHLHNVFLTLHTQQRWLKGLPVHYCVKLSLSRDLSDPPTNSTR